MNILPNFEPNYNLSKSEIDGIVKDAFSAAAGGEPGMYTFTLDELAGVLRDCIETALEAQANDYPDPILHAITETFRGLDAECNCVTDRQSCPACRQAGRIASRGI